MEWLSSKSEEGQDRSRCLIFIRGFDVSLINLSPRYLKSGSTR